MSSLIVLFFYGVGLAKIHYPDQLPWLWNESLAILGAEYNSISISIFNGNGFSDPFQEATGPTAWMPPVLPYALSMLRHLHSGNDQAVVTWMVGLNLLGAAATAYMVLQEARRLRRYALGVILVLGILAANFFVLFLQTNDTSLLLMIVNGLWYGLTRLNDHSRRASWIAWGLFGGLAALCSPVVGATWCIATGILMMLQLKARWRTKHCVSADCGDALVTRRNVGFVFHPGLLSFFVAILCITPWTLRNHAVLGKWVPIKSNGMFELWQSQCVDDDGILDGVTIQKHPWNDATGERAEYKALGEIAYIQKKGEIVAREITASPGKLGTRVGHRFLVAYLLLDPLPGGIRIWEMTPAVWFCMLIHLFPTLAIGVLLLGFRRSGSSMERAKMAMLLLVLLLTPYVLISYYYRYAAMCIGLKALLILYGVDWLIKQREASSNASPRTAGAA